MIPLRQGATRDAVPASAALCPCCGSALPPLAVAWSVDARTFVANDVTVQLTYREAQVFDVIWRAHPRGVYGGRRLTALAYADDIDGGPNSASCVHVHVASIRRKIECAGWTVTKAFGRGGDENYRLVPL